MKVTIEIPEDLYKKTKIRAIECGLTLKQTVLNSLERELQVSPLKQKPVTSYWANRKLLPEFAAAQKAGAYRPKPNVKGCSGGEARALRLHPLLNKPGL